jgi:hypothetical protein
VVCLYKENQAAFTAPAGFQRLTQKASYNNDHQATVYCKVLTAADTGSYVFSWAGSTWIESAALLIRGGAGTMPTLFTTAANPATGTVTPAVSLTGLPAGAFLVHFGTNFAGGNWTGPSGYTLRINYDDLGISYLAGFAGGATGNVQATCNASSSECAALIALT